MVEEPTPEPEVIEEEEPVAMNEEDYLNCKIEDYDFIYPLFKDEYPELFEKDTEERVKIYQFNYLIKQAINIKDIAWIETSFDEGTD